MPTVTTKRARTLNQDDCGQFRRAVIDRDLSVGATLRAAREQLVRTPAYFSKKLGVPLRYVTALEEEDFRHLPGLVYEKHFLHRYAIALHLDADLLVDRWAELRRGEAKPATRFVPRVRPSDLWISPLLIRRGISVLLFAGAIFYVGARLYGMFSPPSLVLRTPDESQIVRDANLTVAGSVPPDTQVDVNGETVATTPDGSFAVPVTLEAGANTIRVVAERHYSQPTVIERRVYLNPINDLSAAPSSANFH